MLRHVMKASPAPGSLHQRKLGEKSRKRNPVDTLVLTHLHREGEQMMLWLKKVRVQYEITFIKLALHSAAFRCFFFFFFYSIL